MYWLLYSAVYCLSRLPLGLLYVLSTGLYFLIYYLARYRRRVVRRNIATSFPTKTKAEIIRIERKYYRWMSDCIVETVKMLTISPREMSRRMEFRGVEEMEKCFDQGQSCAAILGHYCNWEWLAAAGLGFHEKYNAAMGLIYHPLRNKAFDRLMIAIRSHLGGICIAKRDILRAAIRLRQEQRPSLLGYIADQSPKWENIHLFLDFMNHDTPVFTGAEKIMRKMNNAVFYVDMARPRRGHYICTFRLISREVQAMEENAITRRFFKLLEGNILQQPQYYLWSHDRWRRTHKEYDQRHATGQPKQ